MFAANLVQHMTLLLLALSLGARRDIVDDHGDDAFVLVDVENVRGRSDFELTHVQLLARTAVWAREHGSWGRVVAVVDHGLRASGHALWDGGVGVVFAGPEEKADDVLARDAGRFRRDNENDDDEDGRIVVVTSDYDLTRRCVRSSDQVAPMRSTGFLKSLEEAVLRRAADLLDREERRASSSSDEDATSDDAERDDGCDDDDRFLRRATTSNITTTAADDDVRRSRYERMRTEVDVIREIVGLEARLRRRASVKEKKRVFERMGTLREQLLRDAPLALDADCSDFFERPTFLSAFVRGEKDGILRKPPYKHKEQTCDRIIFAERLRNMLETGCFGTSDPVNSDRELKSAQLNSSQMGKNNNAGSCSRAVAYIRYINDKELSSCFNK